MTTLKFAFWLLFFIVFYAYAGYGILLFSIIKFRRITGIYKKSADIAGYEPEVTLFIAAYNEKDFVAEKI